MSAARIYAVEEDNVGGVTRLVKATNQAQALRHVARDRFDVRVASALEVADLMASGVKVQDATRDDPQQDLIEQAQP